MALGQKQAPAGTWNMTSASFPKFFLHRCVINLGTTKTWGSVGFTIRSSLNNSLPSPSRPGGAPQPRPLNVRKTEPVLWGE